MSMLVVQLSVSDSDRMSDRIERFQRKMLRIMKRDLQIDDHDAIKHWMSSGECFRDFQLLNDKEKIEEKLVNIVDDLRKIVPLNGVLNGEQINSPIVGPNSDCTDNTLHVDEFLYEDEDLEKYFGDKLKFCNSCGSNDIKETQLISHSLSRSKLKHLFNVMLPSDCSDKKILDVGSRIGAVLYGAFLYSNCDRICGIEMNSELCNIQRKIVNHYDMSGRVCIVENDVLDEKDLISTFDIIILNNVFEFFVDVDVQIKIWKFFKKNFKRGCLVMTIPSAEETFETLDIYREFSCWLRRVPFYQQGSVAYDVEEELEFHDMYLYEVK